MPTLMVTTRSGQQVTISVATGVTVLNAVMEANIDEVFGICGGCCSCATCHVHVDPAFFVKLPPPSAVELELLDGLTQQSQTSRLACQITTTWRLHGMPITIAKEE